MREKGFVTIATGSERYYKMARTLLRSYRAMSESPMPFALICDRENAYSAEFDDVVVLGDATCSYMDKLRLLKIAPYQENLFIDADCIAYGDLNRYWSFFEGATDVSAIGTSLPRDSRDSYFCLEGIGPYADRVSFIPSYHGVCYFIRPGKVCDEVYQTCEEITNRYSELKFKYFPKPADEPILALAMALHQCKPSTPRGPFFEENGCFAYFPLEVRNLETDFFARRCVMGKEPDKRPVLLVHFGSESTVIPAYTIEAQKVHFYHKKGRRWNAIEKRWNETLCRIRFFILRMRKLYPPTYK